MDVHCYKYFCFSFAHADRTFVDDQGQIDVRAQVANDIEIPAQADSVCPMLSGAYACGTNSSSFFINIFQYHPATVKECGTPKTKSPVDVFQIFHKFRSQMPEDIAACNKEFSFFYDHFGQNDNFDSNKKPGLRPYLTGSVFGEFFMRNHVQMYGEKGNWPSDELMARHESCVAKIKNYQTTPKDLVASTLITNPDLSYSSQLDDQNTVSAYCQRGKEVFEIYGVGEEVVDKVDLRFKKTVVIETRNKATAYMQKRHVTMLENGHIVFVEIPSKKGVEYAPQIQRCIPVNQEHHNFGINPKTGHFANFEIQNELFWIRMEDGRLLYDTFNGAKLPGLDPKHLHCAIEKEGFAKRKRTLTDRLKVRLKSPFNNKLFNFRKITEESWEALNEASIKAGEIPAEEQLK